jgi:hypothetical protein
MKFVKLITSAYVAGVLRHPHEGVLHVEGDQAKRLLDDKVAEDVTADFTAKENKETGVDTIAAADGAAPTAPASEPHQSEVAPQATEGAPKPKAAKAAASKE